MANFNQFGDSRPPIQQYTTFPREKPSKITGDPQHTGVVIFSNCALNRDYRVYIMDLTVLVEAHRIVVRRVSDYAFHVPHPSAYPQCKGREFWKEEQMYNRALYFGDVICWSARTDMWKKNNESVISYFRRVSHKNNVWFPTRCQDGDNQILIDGVVSPNDSAHLFTTEQQVLPNVYLNVWVSLQFNEKTKSLIILFAGFDSVCEHKIQLDVYRAPWNRKKDKNTVQVNKNNSEGDKNFGFSAVGPPKELKGEEAVRTGPRTVLLRRYPNIRAVLPFLNENMEMNLGYSYSVDAVWSDVHNMYVVSRVFTASAKPFIRTTNYGDHLLTHVKRHYVVRGVFVSEELGLLDDPSGCLSLLHLSHIANEAIQVIVTDKYPSRGGHFRFQVEAVYGEQQWKLEKWTLTQRITVEKVNGIVTDFGKVFSKKHASIPFFFLGIWKIVPFVGCFITFSATYDRHSKIFVITKWSYNLSREPLPFVVRQMHPTNPYVQAVFLITGNAPVNNKMDRMIYSRAFGLIDDNLELVEFDQEKPGENYTVWVTLAHYGKEDPFLPRTMFHVVGATQYAVVEDRYRAPSPRLVKRRACHSTNVAGTNVSGFTSKNGAHLQSEWRNSNPDPEPVPVSVDLLFRNGATRERHNSNYGDELDQWRHSQSKEDRESTTSQKFNDRSFHSFSERSPLAPRGASFSFNDQRPLRNHAPNGQLFQKMAVGNTWNQYETNRQLKFDGEERSRYDERSRDYDELWTAECQEYGP